MHNVFAVPIFFVCFRECLETTIIVSVLLSFLKQSIGPERDPVLYKKVRRQVWAGVAAGLLIVLIIGGAFIGVYYGLGTDIFGETEDIWEGTFSIIASVIITIMGAALLRISKLQDKWRLKLAKAMEARDASDTLIKTKFMRRRIVQGKIKHWCEKYSMFLLPFITVLREGLEAVIFIGGVGLSVPATAFPLAVVCGLACGIAIGYLIYRGGNVARLQYFLIVSTCFLYLVAAGLFSKGVWALEINSWNKIVGGDAAEVGSGPGSYDIRKSVWHVNCCNPEINGGGGWGIFNAILGWENSATIGSVLSYNLYWLMVIIGFFALRYNEQHGHWPLMKAKNKAVDDVDSVADVKSDSSSSMRRDTDVEMAAVSKGQEATGKKSMTRVREMSRMDSGSSGSVASPTSDVPRTIEIDA